MIRPFRPDDRDALLEITARAFDGVSIDQNIESIYGPINGMGWQERKISHVEDDIAANPGGIVVFEANGQPVGFASCRVNHRTRIGSIPNLAVHPHHQGKGIGKALLQAALAYLEAQGMEFARIETLEQNRRCMRFYPRAGFREVARQVHYIRPLGQPPSAPT